jgi:ABC-type Mn2+/Zn2+ transport system permease subunit
MRKRELRIMPLIVGILGLVVYLIGDNINGGFSKIFFPQNNSIFELLKVFYTSFLLIYVIGMFDLYKVKNHLLSRVLSTIVMMVVTIILLFIVQNNLHIKHWISLLLIFIVSIVCGQMVGYQVQKTPIKHSDAIALILQTLLAFGIAYLTYFPINL